MTPSERKAFLESIKPEEKGQSDKFSWRIYQRALKNGRERVYVSAWNNITGEVITPDLEALKAGDRKQQCWLMIGREIMDDGWFHGAKLQSVTRKGMQKVDGSFAFGPGFNTSAWLDVTEWFWSAYQTQGRCIVHGDYAHNWISINSNARKCAYCGKHERRTVATKKITKRVESWA